MLKSVGGIGTFPISQILLAVPSILIDFGLKMIMSVDDTPTKFYFGLKMIMPVDDTSTKFYLLFGEEGSC